MGLIWHAVQYIRTGTSQEWQNHNMFTSTPYRHLRGLGEDSSIDGVDMLDVTFVMICIIMAGFASGLTQGLLSLDLMEMEVKARSGTDEEKKYAAKIIPIITNHHILLVTLMLWNASATEALPIFLTALVPEYLAIIISVTLVLFMGEIIPASILTGPNQLKITASLTPLVYLVLAIFFPLAYPISIALDYIIGHDETNGYNRKEISTMMRLQREWGVKRMQEAHTKSKSKSRDKSTHSVEGLRGTLFEEEEVTIIDGALKYREMAVSEVMTSADDVFMINVDQNLDYKLIYEIFKSGYSRIPVYDKDRDDIVGLVLAKDLIFIDPEDATSVRNFMDLFGRKAAVVWHDSKLGETLAMFRQEKSHMAIVRDVENEGESDPTYRVLGIITLEDIVEEILGTEIEDETDAAIGPDGRKQHDFRGSMMIQPAVRDPELARLHTLNNAAVDQGALTDEEVHSIGIFLFTNVPQVQRMFRENMSGLQKFVRSSAVVSIKRTSPLGEKPHPDDYLYRKGRLTNTTVLILEGKVEVIDYDEASTPSTSGTGNGSPRNRIKGPYSTIAPEALEAEEGSCTTDFSAVVATETLRYLRLSKVVVQPPSPRKSPAALRRMQSFGSGHLGRKKSHERVLRTLSIGAPASRWSKDKDNITDKDLARAKQWKIESDDLLAADLYGSKQRPSDLFARESLASSPSRGGSVSQPFQAFMGSLTTRNGSSKAASTTKVGFISPPSASVASSLAGTSPIMTSTFAVESATAAAAARGEDGGRDRDSSVSGSQSTRNPMQDRSARGSASIDAPVPTQASTTAGKGAVDQKKAREDSKL